MRNSKSPQPLFLLTAGVLAVAACSLKAPKFDQSDSGTGASTVTCSNSGGSTGTGSGGGSGSGTGGSSGDSDAGAGDDSAPSAAFVTVTPMACDGTNAAMFKLKYTDGYKPNPDDQKLVQKMISQMSLKDKATQMRGMPWGSATSANFSDTQRSKDTATIRGYHYRDASRGMNLAEDLNGTKPNAQTINGTKVGWATAFPVSMARGAAFDLDLEYAVGEAIGDEMQAAKETLLLAPCMNVLRHPFWGRAQETYGEDSFAIGRLASAMTLGIQQHIAANAKHYMAYDIEFGRDFNNMTLDEQTLREPYGRHFRMVVQDGGVASVMASYNLVNGTKSVENAHILTDVLRTDYGFQGFVLSDWWAMNPQAMIGTDSTTLKRYATNAIKAGLDVELPWALNYGYLESLVQTKSGVTEDEVNRGAARVLEQKVRFQSYDLAKDTIGLGTPKTSYASGKIVYACDGHIDLAKKAAIESMVLMKNASNALPINQNVKKVAVLGATVPYKAKNDGKISSSYINFATDVHTGDLGSSRVFSDPELSIGPFKGIKANAPAGVEVVTGGSVAEASDADFYVVIAGLTSEDEGEEYTLAGDRDSFALDAKQTDPKYQGIQNKLIADVIGTGKPMVVVLEGGSVIEMPWLDQVPAVVMAWYPGMVGGDAMGALLWGKANFSAKLPFTWGHGGDYPKFKGDNGTTNADYYFGYRYFDVNKLTPVFPIGYGLSYTTFEYSNLQLGCSDMSEGAIMPVYVNVKNTGSVAGDEIVMVWVSFPNSKASRRTTIKELKGFARVSLAAGEEKQVLIPVRLKDLDYFDMGMNKWVVEDGDINIMVGGNSTGPWQMGTVAVHGYAKDSSNY